MDAVQSQLSSLSVSDNDDVHRELDMDLDDALREAAEALQVMDDAADAESIQLPRIPFVNGDIDPGSQYWPASARSAPANEQLPTNRRLEPPPTPIGPTQPRPEFLAPTRSPRRQRQNNHEASSYGSERTDLAARTALRDVVFSALLSELAPPERAALLDDCRSSAEQSGLGVPFRDLVSEPMDPFGVPPLMYELLSCQPDFDGINDEELGTGMEVVLFLIEHWRENVLAHGKYGILSWVVRTACLKRFDIENGNRIFQQLRPAIFEKQRGPQSNFVDYDISLGRLVDGDDEPSNPSLDFNALISVPNFASHLQQLQQTAVHETSDNYERRVGGSSSSARKPLPTSPALMRVGIEFLVSQRAWRLEIDSNALKLELLEGPEACAGEHRDDAGLYIDARVRLVAPEPTPSAPDVENGADTAPIELLLPRALLRPISASGRGTHAVTLSPCFAPGPFDLETPRRFDDPLFLHEGTLLLELTVRLAGSESFLDKPAQSHPTPLASTPTASRSQEEPVAGPSRLPLEDDDYDDMYVPDDTESQDGKSAEELQSREADEWEEVSEMDETEESDSGWVKASWSGRDEDM